MWARDEEIIRSSIPSDQLFVIPSRGGLSAAHDDLVADIDDSGVNRQQMVARLTHGLMEALSKVVTSNQPAAVIGCARELNNLLGLISAVPRNGRHH